MAESKIPEKLSSVGRVNRRALFANDDEPKPWWQLSRRTFIAGSAATAGLMLIGGVWLSTDTATDTATDTTPDNAAGIADNTADIEKDSLDLQQEKGWNIGSEQQQLALPDKQTTDSQQSAEWRKYLDSSALLQAYQPQAPEWLPFFVPTLIQSLQSESLRNQLAPIYTSSMRESYGRGQAIAKDFLSNAENASETTIIVDLPGRDSIAFAAGMAGWAQLITTFDNFPHPLGVTPSNETLGAMLYYAAEIEAKRATVPPNSPPAFVLDAKRLSQYENVDTQFDNRYVAKLPSAERLQERGIKSVIYVTPDRSRTEEQDDLNEIFVDYKGKGLNVAMLPLSDLTPVDAGVAGGQTGNETGANQNSQYYYGGSPANHLFFFYAYPFFRPYPAYINRYPGYGAYAGGRGRAPSVAPMSPPRYIPAPRPTMFAGTRIGGSAAGIGRSKPSGFGRTTVRVSPSGSVVGTRAGRSGYYSPGRSGSFGRGGGGYSG